MERLEKSSMAFFAGLSLISSPDNTAAGKKKRQNPPPIEWKFKGEGKGAHRKRPGGSARACA